MEEYTPKFNSLITRLARDIADVIGTIYEIASHKDIRTKQKEKCLDLIAEMKVHSDTVNSLFDLNSSDKTKKEETNKQRRI